MANKGQKYFALLQNREETLTEGECCLQTCGVLSFSDRENHEINTQTLEMFSMFATSSEFEDLCYTLLVLLES